MAKTALTPVTLPADPTLALQAATKQYVDNRVSPVAAATDFNACITTGLYSIANNATNGIGNAAAPGSTGILQVFAIDTTHISQLWFAGNNSTAPEIWTRSNNAGTWCRWESVFGRPTALGSFDLAIINGIYSVAGTATSGPGVTGIGLLTYYGNNLGVGAQVNGVQTWTSYVTGEVWQRQFTASGAFSTWLKIGPSPVLSTLTTKGDLYVATASATVARQGVGANGTFLIADSSQTNGVAWGSAPRVFASTAARDAAITAPTAGMTCITTDTGSYWQYFTTQGWYKPNSVLNRTVLSTTTGAIGTTEADILTTPSLTIAAGRRLAIVLHFYCTFLGNGCYMYAKMDGVAVTNRIIQYNNLAAPAIISGEQTITPAAGNHTFTVTGAQIGSGTFQVAGATEPGYIEVRDWGAA